MANVLKMADQAAIIGLWRRGWSQRRIAQVPNGSRRSNVPLARLRMNPIAPDPLCCPYPFSGGRRIGVKRSSTPKTAGIPLAYRWHSAGAQEDTMKKDSRQ